jgi:nitroreductase
MHELLIKRRSKRKFIQKPISEEAIKEILSAGMISPAYCNQKKYQIIVVQDKEKLEKLSKIGRWVDFVKDCGVGFVLISQETPAWIEDCTLVNAWMMLEAVNQGLDSCWADVKDGQELDGKDREVMVREILNIPDDFRILNILAVGFSEEKIPLHSSKEYREKKVHWDSF